MVVGYKSNLDVFRFFLFIGILISHSHIDLNLTSGFNLVLTLYKIGWTGVQGFFVLSGYLIARKLILEYESQKAIGISNFYRSRLLKIAPSLVVLALITLFVAPAFSIFTASPAWNRIPDMAGVTYLHRATEFAPYLFFVGNIAYAIGLSVVTPALLICWSLCVEEQFYLLFPQWINRSKKIGRLATSIDREIAKLAIKIIVVGVSLRLCIYTLAYMEYISYAAANRFAYTFSLCQFDSIACGVLLACWSNKFFGFRKKFEQLSGWTFGLFLVVCVTVIFAVCSLPITGVYSVGLTCINLIYTLMLLGLISRTFKKQASKAIQWLASLGKNGYCLYLVHSLALVAAASLILPTSSSAPLEVYGAYGLRLAVALLFSIVGASVLYYAVEKPLKIRYGGQA